MKVFISWSGERSQAVASALREWFPLVLHYVDPWLSKSDIKAGDRWSVEIAKELEACNFGIICITRENLNAPWILFEAGALAKSMQDGRVTPLLLDLDFKDVTGPLAQFQATKVDSGGMKELVIGLNKAAALPVQESQVERLFAALWTDFDKQISAIPKSTTVAKQSRPQGEILEELVSGVRNVEMRMRDFTDDDIRRPRRRTKFGRHPGIALELADRVAFGPDDPIHLLVLTSLVRNEIPWLYDLALEVFNPHRNHDRKYAHKARRQLEQAMEVLDRFPFAEELGVDPYTWHEIRSRLQHVLARPVPKPLAKQSDRPQTNTETIEHAKSDPTN